MGLVLLAVFNASVFSIGGLGEDLGIFNAPFLGVLSTARIEFSLQPEITLLNDASGTRGLFWTNPFSYKMKVPFGRGFSLFLGNSERFNQSLDLYHIEDPLAIHLKSNGGVDEFFGQVNCRNNFAEIFFRGTYLFGNTREIWDYTFDNYGIADTFMYKYDGRTFLMGLKIFFISLSFEGFGTLDMSKDTGDTTYELSQVLTFGLDRILGDYDVSLLVEHVLQTGGGTIDRMKIGFGRGRLGVAYYYNPWYFNDVKEHGIKTTFMIPVQGLGFCSFDLNASFRTRNAVREFRIVPELRFTLEEIFSRRRK